MTIRLSHAFVTVDDPDKALTFYRDVLGLEVRQDVPFQGFRWLTVGPADQPDLQIGLLPPEMGRSEGDAAALHALLAKGVLSAPIFRCDDIDAEFARISAAGVEVLQEPIDQPYGVRDCAFRDPSGNMIRFSSERTP